MRICNAGARNAAAAFRVTGCIQTREIIDVFHAQDHRIADRSGGAAGTLEDYHQQYLARNPAGYCGLGGTGVACPIGAGIGA